MKRKYRKYNTRKLFENLINKITDDLPDIHHYYLTEALFKILRKKHFKPEIIGFYGNKIKEDGERTKNYLFHTAVFVEGFYVDSTGVYKGIYDNSNSFILDRSMFNLKKMLVISDSEIENKTNTWLVNELIEILDEIWNYCVNKAKPKYFMDTKYGDLSGQVYEGDIDVSSNNLDSLEGAPKKVHGSFDVSSNNLLSLKYGPEIVSEKFSCGLNRIEDFEYAPRSVGSFHSNGSVVKSLKGLTDTVINNNLHIINSGLENLKYFPKVLGKVLIQDNRLQMVKGIKFRIDQDVVITSSPEFTKNIQREINFLSDNPNLTESELDLLMLRNIESSED